MYKEIDSNKRKTVLLIFSFLLIVIGLGWVFSYAYNNPVILYGAVGFSIFQALISYYYSDKIALSMSGAHEIQKKDSPELYRIVENLAITGGLPMPKVYIINDPSPNAFATGRDPKHSAVAVTTGLMERLNKQELQGVMAHEMSHIGNYDIRVMTIVVVLVGIVTLIADFFIRMAFYGDRDRDSRLQLIMMIVGIVLAILAPIFAAMIQFAVSRRREYLADASASLLTRYPEGLASALEKISADPRPLKMANKATAHLFISDPTKKEEKKLSSKFRSLFSTHPPIEDRVARLRQMGK